MKKVLLFVLFLIIALPVYLANASPFLICDPQQGVIEYQVTGWSVSTIPAQADGSLRMDIASASVGTTPLTFKACNLWECSAAVPFDLVREPPVTAPKGLKLVR